MGSIKIVHNKLLGGWYVVRGAHHFPLSGKFATKAEAKAWLAAPHPRMTAKQMVQKAVNAALANGAEPVVEKLS